MRRAYIVYICLMKSEANDVNRTILHMPQRALSRVLAAGWAARERISLSAALASGLIWSRLGLRGALSVLSPQSRNTTRFTLDLSALTVIKP